MPDLPAMVKAGSVKDIYGDADRYYFKFSDRYSVFDWGAMPDELPCKGQALACAADMLFREFQKPWQQFQLPENLPEDLRAELNASAMLEHIRAHGIGHHSLGLVNDEMQLIGPGRKSNFLAVVPVQVLEPAHSKLGDDVIWNYQPYVERPENTIIPLEIIFRFGTPEGSSFLNRADDSAYLDQLQLSEAPQAGDWLERPILEFSTKLEPSDRMLSYAEAQKISGCTDREFLHLRHTVLCLAIRFQQICADMGLELWDGKFEFAFGERINDDERELILIDSIGPDELRLMHEGAQFSKEIIRKIYRDSAWAKAVAEAKSLAKKEGLVDWKKICVERLKQTPEPITAEQKRIVSAIYTSFANALAVRFGHDPVFADAPDVLEVCRQLKGLV